MFIQINLLSFNISFDYKLLCKRCFSFSYLVLDSTVYCVVQSGGRVKLWGIGDFKNLAEKTLANCNKLSFSSLIKTCHWHTTLNLKPQSFILSSRLALK